MKAIVAKLLFGGIFGCLSWSNFAWAEPISGQPPLNLSPKPTFSARFSSQVKVVDRPQGSSLFNRIAAIHLNLLDSLEIQNQLSFLRGKKPYVYQSEQTNIVLGFQNTFWPSVNQHKYWGVTTVEHWGTGLDTELGSSTLNYTESAPILAAGNSKLTFSGGGQNNLGTKIELDQQSEIILDEDRENSLNFEQFRGGVTYHHGLLKQLTMGIGFVYEDLFVGFTQLTYDSKILPVKTTLSLLTEESKTTLYSHVRLKPAPNFVVNYRSDQARSKFDLNWKVASDFTVVAKGDSKHDSYSTGIRVAINNNFLGLSATAALDNNHNLEWKLSSQIGGFKFIHSSNQHKSSVELRSVSVNSGIGFKCSAFLKYQTKQVKLEQEEFVVWGSKIHSANKISQGIPRWSLNLGYGTGYHGTGLIAKSSIALKPNLALNLDYQEISAESDETKVKLQLSSQQNN